MAIVGTKQTEAPSGTGSFKLFTGVAALKVIAVNPTQEELKALGYKAEKAPEYAVTNKKTGRPQKLIRFILEFEVGGKKYKTDHAVFMESQKKTDVWIDKFGKFGKDRTKIDTASARNPYEGEIELLDILQAWVAPNKNSEFYLDTIDNIATAGSTSELKTLLKNFGDNLFKGLLYVRDSKYQAVWGKKFERIYSRDLSYLHKKLVQEQSYLNGDFGPIDFALYTEDQFKVREFTPSGDTATADVSSAPTGQSQVDPGAGQAEAADDDAPF